MKIFTTGLKAFIVFCLTAQMAWAVPILVRNGTTSSGEGGYGSSGWSQISGLLDTASGSMVTVASDFTNSAQVLAASGLWVNTGSLNGSSNLSAAEITNIQTFISGGGHVVLFGENTGWTSWNNNILSIVGGTQGGSVGGVMNTLLAHPLTTGVTSINVPSGASASGGTALFSQNIATLWGAGNVLSFLDSNTLQDSFIGNANNLQFGQNLTSWITDSSTPPTVPEPATLALLGLGLAGIGFSRKKKTS